MWIAAVDMEGVIVVLVIIIYVIGWIIQQFSKVAGKLKKAAEESRQQVSAHRPPEKKPAPAVSSKTVVPKATSPKQEIDPQELLADLFGLPKPSKTEHEKPAAVSSPPPPPSRPAVAQATPQAREERPFVTTRQEMQQAMRKPQPKPRQAPRPQPVPAPTLFSTPKTPVEPRAEARQAAASMAAVLRRREQRMVEEGHGGPIVWTREKVRDAFIAYQIFTPPRSRQVGRPPGGRLF